MTTDQPVCGQKETFVTGWRNAATGELLPGEAEKSRRIEVFCRLAAGHGGEHEGRYVDELHVDGPHRGVARWAHEGPDR